MKTQREMHCRECGAEWEANASADELPLECPMCESRNTYSAVGTGAFQLRHNRGDKCGWALSGYTNEKIIDLRDRDIGTRQDREANTDRG